MKVKVFGRRDLIERIDIFKYDKIIYEILIHIKIKDPGYEIEKTGFRKKHLKYKYFHIFVKGPTKKDDILISISPDTPEELNIINGFEVVKIENYKLYITLFDGSANDDRVFHKVYND